MPSSRGSSPPRDQTRFSYVSCISWQVLYHQRHLGSASVLCDVSPNKWTQPWAPSESITDKHCPTSSLDNHPPDISLHCYAFLWPSCHKPSRNNKYLESQDWHEWTTLINLCQYSDIGLSFRRDNEGGCSQVPSDCLQSFSPNHTPSPYARLGVYKWKGQLGLGAF